MGSSRLVADNELKFGKAAPFCRILAYTEKIASSLKFAGNIPSL